MAWDCPASPASGGEPHPGPDPGQCRSRLISPPAPGHCRPMQPSQASPSAWGWVGLPAETLGSQGEGTRILSELGSRRLCRAHSGPGSLARLAAIQNTLASQLQLPLAAFLGGWEQSIRVAAARPPPAFQSVAAPQGTWGVGPGDGEPGPCSLPSALQGLWQGKLFPRRRWQEAPGSSAGRAPRTACPSPLVEVAEVENAEGGQSAPASHPQARPWRGAPARAAGKLEGRRERQADRSLHVGLDPS